MASANKTHEQHRGQSSVGGSIRELTEKLSVRVGAWKQRPSALTKDTSSEPISAQALESDLDLATMLEQPPSRELRATGYVVTCMVLCAFVLAATVEIDMVVQGAGEMAVDAPPIVLQPMERTAIQSIDVKPGEVVKKGQKLATLDSTFVDADVAAVSGQRALLASVVARLEAEAAGRSYHAASAEDGAQLQSQIYRQRQEQYTSRLASFDADIKRLESIISGNRSQMEFVTKQLQIAIEVERMRNDLLEKQHTSRLQALDSKNIRLRAEREQQEVMDRTSEATYAIEAKRAERQSFIDDWNRVVLEELEKSRNDLSRVEAIMEKAHRMQQLVNVRAPEDAVVLEVAERSSGSVLREAEPLITLIPLNAPMIAEVMISSRDIGYTKLGDEVAIKVDAFPYQRFGMLTGILRSVSEASYSQSGPRNEPRKWQGAGAAMHRVRITLPSSVLEKLPAGGRVIPGMSVTAEVKVGTRSVLQYLFDPIRRGFSESFREAS